MTRFSLSFATALTACTMLAAVAQAQAQAQTTAPTHPTPGNMAPGATSNAPMPGVSSSTGVTPSTGVVNRNSGTAAASGDRNQAVTTTSANAPQPARGANSFTEGEVRRRLEANGFQNVGGLHKDDGGVWRGTATKGGQTGQVWLDYKGNAGQESGTTAASGTPSGAAISR